MNPATTVPLLTRWGQAIMPTYGPPALHLVRGQGAYVWDADGQRYLDLLAGIAVNVVGHAHPAVLAAVSQQLSTLGHVSNLYATEPAVALAERLLDLLDARGPGRVFFANSGAEANEAALKLARRYGAERGRLAVVAARSGFHGRTFGALAVTGNPAKREPFAPLPGPVEFVDYGDLSALRDAVGPQVAAVILEPVQGEAGVIIPPAGYLAAARRICDEAGALLILDEVQSGIGRTGRWFAFQHSADVRPDVVTLAKGLGGGLPIGACVALSPVAATVLGPGMHGSTFGGNPVCAAAALAVLDTIDGEQLLAAAGRVGALLADGLRGAHPLIARVDGLGLWLGIELSAPVAAGVELAARQAGFLVNAATVSRVRLAPPLVLTEGQADTFLTAVPALLSQVTP